MPDKNILFLCYANMCLSPLAEGVLNRILKEKNIQANIDSAGFEAYHINEPPDKRAVSKGFELGIDISDKRVRLFSREDLKKFDRIYVMDTLAYRNAIDFARSEEERNKIDFLMNVLHPGQNESVPDPFYARMEASNEAFRILEIACEKIAETIS
jgi:protein-tyrosine phosphatase